MHRSVKTATLFCGTLLLGVVLGVSARAPRAHAETLDGDFTSAAQRASEAKEPAPDPNKKKAGDPCKSSDECQRHHSCVKVGDKNVCQAPQRRLPPGAVT